MEVNEQWLNSMGSIGYFLAAFPALWIAGRIILRNYSGDNGTAQIFLWLALGGLILAPMTDFIRYISSILSLIVPLFRISADVTVFLGMGSFMVYSGITLVLGIVVYSLALYYLRMIVVRGKIPIVQELLIVKWELGFVLLGIAGLINHMVSSLVISFVSIYLPSLTDDKDIAQLLSGYWISWLLAFLVLFVTLWIMNNRLSKRDDDLLERNNNDIQ